MGPVYHRICIASIALAVVCATAQASPSLTYNVVDLGVGQATLSSNGVGVVIAPDGTSYAFPRTDHIVADPASLLAQLPAAPNPDSQYGMVGPGPVRYNAYAFSFYAGPVLQTNNGTVLVTAQYGIQGAAGPSGSELDAYTKSANGTFGGPGGLWTSSDGGGPYSGPNVAHALDVNNNGLILGSTLIGHGLTYFLYNLNTDTPNLEVPFVPFKSIVPDLAALVPNWSITSAVALDDKGDVLLYAYSDSDWKTHSLLLTATNVSPSPVPEPGALMTIAIGLGGFLIRNHLRTSRETRSTRQARSTDR